MSVDTEMVSFFVEEAIDSLEKLEASCISLSQDLSNREEVESVFRVLHNLKGTSKAVGLDSYGDFIHKVEDYFQVYKNEERPLATHVIEIIFKVQEDLLDWIETIRDTNCEKLERDTELTELLLVHHDLEDKAEDSEGAKTEEQEEKSEAQDKVKPAAVISREAKEASKVTASKSLQARRKAGAETIRVNTAKIDSLLKNIAELTINSSMITDAFKDGDSERLGDLLERNTKMLKNVQDRSFELRMSSLKPLFQRIHRAAVQIASKQQKEIEFIIEGDDVELDRTVIDEIGEALTHVIRNAVDHGIEDKEDRDASNKEKTARVHILALQESDSVEIIIRDDGKGMCAEKLKSKAVGKGIISEAEAADMSNSEAYDLVFSSGFSTAEVITDVSGRGVGMSAVKDTVENLSGEVSISSAIGVGSEFRIRLPATVSIIDGICLKIQNQNIIVPLRKIKEIVSLSELKVQTQITGSKVAEFRKKKLCIENLGGLLSDDKEIENQVCFIIEKGGSSLGLLAPGNLKMNQVVVKSIGEKLSELPYLNGVTILGNGDPAFILDIYKIHDDYYGGQICSKIA